MPKHIDNVPTLDEFRAPWESESGEDAEINKPKLKRYLHALLTDKAKAQDAREETAAELAESEKALEAAKAEAADANGVEAQKKIDRLQKKVDDLSAERDKLVSDKELAELRADVLGDLPEKYAKYVKGETREELEESYKEIREDFDLPEPGEERDPDDERDEDDDEPVVRTQPRALRNPVDKGGRTVEQEIDYDAEVEKMLGTGAFG